MKGERERGEENGKGEERKQGEKIMEGNILKLIGHFEIGKKRKEKKGENG